MRHIPEAGAVCGNSARTDLCGGRGVTSVPTATNKTEIRRSLRTKDVGLAREAALLLNARMEAVGVFVLRSSLLHARRQFPAKRPFTQNFLHPQYHRNPYTP